MSTPAIGQERRPSLIQLGHGEDVVATGDAKQSQDLWIQAYKALKCRNPELIAAYERLLASNITDSAESSLSPELIEAIVKSKLQDREANQLVIDLGKGPVKVREQGEKVIKFVLWSNDIIAQALSAQPYAALAWSGVSIILPVSCAFMSSYTGSC